MEKFLSIEELTQVDRRNLYFVDDEGNHRSLEQLHDLLSQETLNAEIPDDLKSQFNIAKTMALYTYYYYALAPEVHLKTYLIIEHALRLKLKPKNRHEATLNPMLRAAVKKKLICDSGFRSFNQSEPGIEKCTQMIKAISHLRNSKAHGSSFLMGDCMMQISVCADFLNQLYSPNS